MPSLGEVSREQFLAQCSAYADSVEQDMATVAAQLDSGLLTQAEHDQIMVRLADDYEEIAAVIERNRAQP